VLSPSEPIDESRHQAGFRLEVRDGADQTRYVRGLPDPRDTQVEAATSGPHGDHFVHVEVPRRCDTFTVLVPDYGEGTQVVLIDRPADTRSARQAGPTEVARLALHEEG
jgi:hypothetical protein